MDMLKSLFCKKGVKTSDEVLAWIQQRNKEIQVNIREVPFDSLSGWVFDPKTGDLVHQTRKFFSIEGVHVFADNGRKQEWEQPIINQPEVGLLGILAKKIDGVLCFLLQAKIEPGNVNNVQLSPTIQATRSNYSQVHGGNKPRYLDYFANLDPSCILLDQLQSEQGSRFLRKRNRNVIVLVKEDVAAHEDFCWVTLGQIKELMKHDNVVSMDTRTVVSALSFGRLSPDLSSSEFEAIIRAQEVSNFGEELFRSEMTLASYSTIDKILFWLSALKSKYELVVNRKPLKDVRDWSVNKWEIVRDDRRFFRVIGVEVMIENREVKTWFQPLVQPMQEGICVFIIKKINNVYHFLVQAKVECGNFDVVEMAPTIQCMTGDYKEGYGYVPCYLDYVLMGKYKRKIYDTKQSEEGGRFYREQNRNLIVEADSNFDEKIPENFMWLTLGQLKEFLRFNNYLNIQARSLIASLEYI